MKQAGETNTQDDEVLIDDQKSPNRQSVEQAVGEALEDEEVELTEEEALKRLDNLPANLKRFIEFKLVEQDENMKRIYEENEIMANQL